MTPDKRILRVYFDGLCFFNFYYLVFIGIIGGTPDERISEGIFRGVILFLLSWFYKHYRGGPLINIF